MSFSSINIQGNIISSEILDKIRNEDIKYQNSADFGLSKNNSIRDEIGIAWAAARAHYAAFKIRMDRWDENETGTSETRNSWILPLLRELGYDVEKANAFVHPDTQKTYAISHMVANRGEFPVHIMGMRDNLDARRDAGGPRLSPHSLMQEYLNHTEHTYGIVTNGQYLRLLRDATRLVRISFLEFDLVKIMEDELYSDFAILFRLLHVTRLPKAAQEIETSYLEYYHQESLSSGSRIREELSKAVEKSIKQLANGFLSHPLNDELRSSIEKNQLSANTYYQNQLRLIYRILFLAVTEERNLIYAESNDEEMQRRRKLYYDYYSIEHLRKLAGRLQYMDGSKYDLWEGLKATFILFEKGFYGKRLGIEPLGSGLFGIDALKHINTAYLNNEVLLQVIRNLTYFENKHKQWVRVNYSDLDVEEFGSVYEGLLELEPYFNNTTGILSFDFRAGNERSKAGAHYTPEELVKPLIKHSLEYIIEDKLKETDPEKALLSITVCDVACGSGHILLSAARRIALQLAILRETKASGGRSIVEQPSPGFVRAAMRDVIRHCIYGVDKNEMAVELCKVALWLEAHVPGEPLNFLDHKIKCGDSIVGLAHKEELKKGIPDEAFKTLPGDEKEVAQAFAKRNKAERKTRDQTTLNFEAQVSEKMDEVLAAFDAWNDMPEHTPEQVEAKAAAYRKLVYSDKLERLKTLADIQVGQFFIPKTTANKDKLVTDGLFNQILRGEKSIPQAAFSSTLELAPRRFFHWFMEFPEVFGKGGFDCILGNPPYLGGSKFSFAFGNAFMEYLHCLYSPAQGRCDLAAYFIRRNFQIINSEGFIALITTNSIDRGETRDGGLGQIEQSNGTINFAQRSIKWPGQAAVEVTLVALSKRTNVKTRSLDNCSVQYIDSFLSNSNLTKPFSLFQNYQLAFQGSNIYGKGFIITKDQALQLLNKSALNQDVLSLYLTGDEINNNYIHHPERYVINFWNRSLEQSKAFDDCIQIVEDKVRPEREKVNRERYKKIWWQFGEKCENLYRQTANLQNVIALSRVTKYIQPVLVPNNCIFSDATVVFKINNFWFLAILNSTFHYEWCNFSSSALASTIRYNPSDCISNYPLAKHNEKHDLELLDSVGKSYHDHRAKFMTDIQLGLTKTYNLFHSNAITAQEVNGKDKQVASLIKHLEKTENTISFEEAVTGILKLRELHVEMDHAVLEAYGWHAESEDGPAIALRHDFYEVDYLPENDRVRYTIHPEARKEVLKRLLALNHKIYEEEIKQGMHKESDVRKFYEGKGKEVSSEVLAVLQKNGKHHKIKKSKSSFEKGSNHGLGLFDQQT